jgi:hypothetical protein
VTLRRRPYALPDPDQLPGLVAVLLGRPFEPAEPLAFVEAAIGHRVVGACAGAAADGHLGLSDPAASALRDAHTVSVLRATLMRRELPRVAEALSNACGAAPIVLKGAAIADRFYDPASLRSFADLDLLVPAAVLRNAVDALAADGYREKVELRSGFAARHGHDIHVAKPVGRRTADVELHWKVGDDPIGDALSHAALAPHAVPAADAAEALYPSRQDQLIVCSMHLLSDRLKRLCWVEDVRRIALALDDREWHGSFGRARDLGLLWVLNTALDYAAHHLELERPRPLGPGEPPPWGPLLAVEQLDMRASLHVGRLAALPWRDRPRYLRDVLLPSRQGLEGTVGGDGAGRIRLAGRHAGRAIRSLRGGR